MQIWLTSQIIIDLGLQSKIGLQFISCTMLLISKDKQQKTWGLSKPQGMTRKSLKARLMHSERSIESVIAMQYLVHQTTKPLRQVTFGDSVQDHKKSPPFQRTYKLLPFIARWKCWKLFL